MSSIVLMLLLSVIGVCPAPSCPASCVVCSDNAVICNRLTHIIDAPDTIQALLLTEGYISTVQSTSLSELRNITVIALSHNHISVLSEQSFRTLPSLHTLMLDHNLLTSQALKGGALTNLTQLEVLALGHNLISMIQGRWFKGSKSLQSLKLEGNLLTSLDSGSFPLNDLKYLESLDLSDNLIDHLGKNSFRGLVSLQTLDLSRNRLRSAPTEAFSYLSWLTNLDLDLNSWNCSCQLLELAAFLSAFIQQPDKTLYNGRQMVCVSADNPAVTTVLELTEANCVPSNQNITVQIQTRGSVTPQLYARDLAIAAVTCFIGGVGLTLLLVLTYYKVSLRKKLKKSEEQKVEEEGSSTIGNHQDVSEKRRDFLLQANSSLPWDREVMVLDPRTEDPGHQFKSRVDENNSQFWCPDCSPEGQRVMGPDPVRWKNRINVGEKIEKRRVRMMSEQREGNLSWEFTDKRLSHGNINSSSHSRKETLGQRAGTLVDYRGLGEDYRTDMEGNSRRHETLHCKSCHRTYRPPEQDMKKGRIHTNMRDAALFNGFPSQYRQIDRVTNLNWDQSDMLNNTEFRRKTRNITFDLGRSRNLDQENSQGKDRKEEVGMTSRNKERGPVTLRTHKSKVQSSPLLKVKLNLNPLRKSRVHPKRKTEQGHSEKSSSKKSKHKRQAGKEREERRGKGGTGKKTNENTKTKGSTKGSTEDCEEDKGEDRGEGRQEGKGTSKRRHEVQEVTEGDQNEKKHPENSEPGDTTGTADQSASAIATGQGQHLQGGHTQYQGAELILGQHPFSLSATDRSPSTPLSLLRSAGSQPTAHSLSLQGGNATMAPGSNSPFPSCQTNSLAPGIVINAPNMTPSGAPAIFSRQVGVDLMAPLTSHPASAEHANTLQASTMHTSPLHTLHPAGPPSSSTANPAVNPAPGQSFSLPPDTSPLIERLKSEPPQGPAGTSQEPQTQESLTLPTQASPSTEVFSGVTPPGPLTTAESRTEMRHVPALPEGRAVSGDSMQAADVPASGANSMSAHSASSAGEAGTSAALLQQEYLSGEGGSSPRRKLRLVLPEKTSSRPSTALERKIR